MVELVLPPDPIEDFTAIPEHIAVAEALAATVVETARLLAAKQAAANEHNKTILKEALKEWLDDKFAAFGKWSAMGIAVAILGLVAYFLLKTSGWSPPPANA